MPLINPPSRLSPPPGTNLSHLLSSAGHDLPDPYNESDDGNDGPGVDDPRRASQGEAKRTEAPKRGYRACVHCRLRKAKCDLGDVNAPSEPPCSRCRREQRECVFLPSKRRRKTNSDADQASASDPPTAQSQSQARPARPATSASQSFVANTSNHNDWSALSIQTANQTFQGWPEAISTSVFRETGPTFSYPDIPHHVSQIDIKPHITPINNFPSLPVTGSVMDFRPFQDFVPDLPALPSAINQATPASADSTSTSALSPTARAKKRQNTNPDATRRIVVANFSNETDALEILADAATDNDDKDKSGGEDDGVSTKRVQFRDHADLSEYLLVKQGIVTEAVLWILVHLYFEHHHPVLPIIQTPRIPRTPQDLAKFASEDPFLLSCLVIVASAHHSDPTIRLIHERVWSIVRETLSDFTFGGVEASLGLVEGILLLAEFLPREPKPSAPLLSGKSEGGLHGTDNRRGWALTGLAIRAAYGLQLDQAALETQPRSMAQERARLVWTWCYLYDRTIGLRTGLAFWSRGPSICFSGYSHISQTGEVAAKAHFPSMLSPTPAEFYDTVSEGTPAGADSASLIQALMELTQIMTNAHDTLYPTKVRTDDLVRRGGYFRHLDTFRRALESFKIVWEDRKWHNESLKELTWCTYEMTRLYVSSFAFQAHVLRAWARAEGTTTGIQLFPRGGATSPDALYIYASVDAANEILSICLRLSKMGVLCYLPSRYLINFVFGGVFALKAGYSGAVGRSECAETRELVNKVCTALVLASPDRDHPAVRYGQMLRLLSKKLEQLSDQSAVPSRFTSPDPPAQPAHPPLTIQDAQTSYPDNSRAMLNGGNMGGQDTVMPQLMASGMAHTGLTPPQNGLEGLFDFDVDVNFNLEGFWDDFTLAEGGGFPFR